MQYFKGLVYSSGRNTKKVQISSEKDAVGWNGPLKEVKEVEDNLYTTPEKKVWWFSELLVPTQQTTTLCLSVYRAVSG
jgi:hypothetical protein